MDALAGGSDADSGGDQTTTEAAPQAAAEAFAQPAVTAAVEQGNATSGAAEASLPEPVAAKAPDQVANLNAAIRETRSENKALKQQLQELTAKIESLAKPPAKAEEPAEPDFLADPKGYVDDAKKKLAELTAKIEDDKKQQTEAQQKAQEAQETWNKVLSAEAEFSKTAPDYQEALQHIRTVTTAQIKLQFPQATDEQIARHIQQQEFQGAAQIVADGRNPSQVYYEYAKLIGYKPKAADPAPSTAAAKPDKDAVRTMGSGGATESAADDDGPSDSPLGGLLAAAQNEHKAQFKRRK